MIASLTSTNENRGDLQVSIKSVYESKQREIRQQRYLFVTEKF